MEIELLFTNDCPCWRFAQDNLKAALAAEEIWVPVRLVQVGSMTEAGNKKFFGSPSIRINGDELWPDPRLEYTLKSRIYMTPQGPRGWPTVAMLRQKLRELQPQL
jgi:hypothetical protein